MAEGTKREQSIMMCRGENVTVRAMAFYADLK